MTGDIDRTQTLETADDVDASATVLTRRRLALVDVDGASVAGESSTLADRPRATFFADTTVLARVWVAVATVLASLATQTGGALAAVVVVQVVATAVEEAR